MRHEGGDADQPPGRPGLDEPRLGGGRQFEEGSRHRILAGIPGHTIELAHLRAVREAGIADDDVEMAEGRHSLLDEARRRAGLAEVAFEEERLRARTGDESRDPFQAGPVAPSMQGDRRIGRRQGAGGCGADARGGTGDEDDAGWGSHERGVESRTPSGKPRAANATSEEASTRSRRI